MNFLTKLFAFLDEFLKTLYPPTEEKPMPSLPPSEPSRRELIYKVAVAQLGKDASPKNVVSSDLACVESVAAIVRSVMPFPDLYGTAQLLDFLKRSKQWKATLELKEGNILVSPTGEGVGHGHCGIFGTGESIMSNDSRTGLWQVNYTVKSWVKYFRQERHFHLYVFEAL